MNASRNPTRPAITDVLVIGAGPAGLCLGRELQQRGLSFLLLERGSDVGESWRRMPAHLKLVSPWKASSLPGGPKRSWRANREISRVEFLEYLRQYGRDLQLPVRTEAEVLAIRREPDGDFHVETTRGEFASRVVVNATGYFQNPYTPTLVEAGGHVLGGCSILRLHSADYDSADAIAQRLGRSHGSILVVGQRLSAGQIIEELVSAGYSVALSHHRPLEYGAGALGWWIFFRIHPWIEAMKLFWAGAAARGFDVRMPGGRPRQLIENRTVRLFPAIASIERNEILFASGQRLQPDVILFATGFRPALAHLRQLHLSIDPGTGRPPTREMESTEDPGLYFLGLDRVRNFQSRFIRGIRRDAVVLAERLAAALK